MHYTLGETITVKATASSRFVPDPPAAAPAAPSTSLSTIYVEAKTVLDNALAEGKTLEEAERLMNAFINSPETQARFKSISSPTVRSSAVTVIPYSSAQGVVSAVTMANRSIVPSGAGFGVAPQSIKAYERLVLTQKSKVAGIHEMWPGGKNYYPHEAFSFMVNDPSVARRTAYDYTWMEMTGHSISNLHQWVKYTVHSVSFSYQDAARYFATLESEYDYKQFLSLLKLRRSAGVESAYPGTYNYIHTPPIPLVKQFVKVAEMPGTFTLGVPAMNPAGLPVIAKIPFNPFKDGKYLGDMRRNWEKGAVASGGLVAVGTSKHDPEKIDTDELTRLLNSKYLDYDTNHAAFVDQAFRFRERVLAFALHETGKMLDWAQLEDLDALVTLSNYIAAQGAAPYTEIGKDEFIDVYFGNKNLTLNQMPVNFSTTADKISVAGFGIFSIPDILRMQYESAILIFLLNQPKYFGRLIQLGDHNAVLRENNIPSFQQDPWRNPFLVFDLAASKAAGKPIYKDTAAALASKPAESRIVTSEFIPLSAMEKAPEAWARYVRTSQGGGVYTSEFAKTGAGTSAAPWILAAIAAAGGFYLMNR